MLGMRSNLDFTRPRASMSAIRNDGPDYYVQYGLEVSTA